MVALLPSALATHFLVATMELHLGVHEFELHKDGAARWTSHAMSTTNGARAGCQRRDGVLRYAMFLGCFHTNCA